jgi:hypothetical protein
MNALERIVSDLINGNLTDARKRAKKVSTTKLISGLEELAGYSTNKAVLAARYLKTCEGFQAYFDAK